MPASNSRLSLGFESDFGGFRVEPNPETENIYNLSYYTTSNEQIELEKYCSISDAVSAVAQQQTGCAAWDQLPPEQVPPRVHNLASWNFSQKEGTFPRAACSQ
ncbi:hypothetical protein QEH52_14995 [Coraliomargarita sp. SDUM461003]|uniref:Uncharacterized protein n=1 Tax=Thalassobacterium maritimum TaxID=3041265 RepID=A0ABU1AYX1_9BACT|nr:hypothetical protein [Coraliomargarita sp. SDUM461003]MBT62223.1 hypothetical protein [Puniceicoccaceae bacterium]MDQ8208832.1 hypothetical protein [Coraliomargarita sp. SDUM461003]HBR94160.1 hypothetical protein [Opitutae bacterium]|tara:strand:- start:354 stop:662 length:309 start_codon:yes stop_codon:yes gene_type:complete